MYRLEFHNVGYELAMQRIVVWPDTGYAAVDPPNMRYPAADNPANSFVKK